MVGRSMSAEALPPLDAVALALVTGRKGILAVDESFPTIGKRFAALSIASTAENRRSYRETLFTAPGLGKFISGAILFDETLRQHSSDGTPMAAVLARQGIIPGIKVDLGTTALVNFEGEKITEGLDGLRDRLKQYHELGARFTKWRAVLTIAKGCPTRTCIDANAGRLAVFAALSQEAGLVPIVEPEILMDGDHTIDRCEDAADATLLAVFNALAAYRVRLEALLLKPAMVMPGTSSTEQASDEDIARRTLRVLRRRVPSVVPGIVFLSGGQTPEQATARLAAINRAAQQHAPWALTFSFGRALQEPALAAWHGKPENMNAAQAALLDVARKNSATLRTSAV